jgi:NADPH2:quinone reductase
MKAVQLSGYNGLDSLEVVEVERPEPKPNEILIEVKAAGINFAEVELTKGMYKVPKTPPFVMGFEAAGVVGKIGAQVKNFKLGDRATAIVSSGGHAEYATADAAAAIPIPPRVSFAEASTISVQGLSAYALLKFAAKPQPNDTVLVQAAAGGVGVYLVQLAKLMGVKKVIALAGSQKKIDLVKKLGADVVINYEQENWTEEVLHATGGNGVDVVLEAASGKIGEESFKLLAPFGRMVIYGARNIHDTFGPDRLQQLIYKNQSVTGFNIPSLRPQQIAECVLELLQLITAGKVKMFADISFPLAQVRAAYEAIQNRETFGKVVLVP